MWVSRSEVSGWIRVSTKGGNFWVIPVTDPNFSKLADDRYASLLEMAPEVGSLALLRAYMRGDTTSMNRGLMNLRKVGRGDEEWLRAL